VYKKTYKNNKAGCISSGFVIFNEWLY